MKKVVVLTYFDGINYGAFAQTYALQKKLESFGCEALALAYKSLKHHKNEYLSLFKTTKFRIFLRNYGKYRKFRNSQKLIRKSKRYYFPRSLKNIGKYDLVIFGSDEIWNFKNNLSELDLAFFGKYFSEDLKKASYAASFGGVSLTDKIPGEIIKLISKLDKISVRDENSRKILLQALPNKKVFQVLDPTFLYDFKNEIRKIELSEDFIVFYGISIEANDQSFLDSLLTFSNDRNLKIISLGYYHDWADISLTNLTPFDWISYIDSAKFVVTNMFHGTIFAIKCNKNFITLNSNRRRNKIDSLVADFKLQNRIVDGSIGYESFSKILNSKIDYQAINNLISLNVQKSEEYLSAIINLNESE